MVTVKVFTDFEEILKMENVWNCDFALSFENPTLFSRIFCGVMQFCETRGWTPLIFTFWSNNRLVGVVPLKLRKFLNTNYVVSLADDIYSDFVLPDEHREKCISILMDILFNRLKCMSATITLESHHNLKALKSLCPKNLKYNEEKGSGRAIIPVDKSYDQFYGSLKHKVRNHFQRTKRKFDSLDSWKVNRMDINSEAIKRVLAVDKKSWKADWRTKNSIEEDDILHIILDGSQTKDGTEPIYEPEAWFLEVNGVPIAYQIVLHYKGTACFIKTSYDLQFKKYSPGTFLIDSVIREIFKKGTVKKIDFVTNLAFVKVWKPTCQHRIQVTIENKARGLSVIRKVLKRARELREKSSFSNNPRVSALLKVIESKMPIK
jgi:hypothetical protein